MKTQITIGKENIKYINHLPCPLGIGPVLPYVVALTVAFVSVAAGLIEVEFETVAFP